MHNLSFIKKEDLQPLMDLIKQIQDILFYRCNHRDFSVFSRLPVDLVAVGQDWILSFLIP